MSMKKMLALLLALVMVLSLAACAGSGEKDDKKNDDTKAPAANQEKEPTGESNKDPEKPGLNDELPTTGATDKPVVDEPSVDEPSVDEPSDEPGEGPVERPTPNEPETSDAVAAFVEGTDGQEFLKGIEQDFTASGLTCNSTIEAFGTGFILTICINELDNVDEETAAAMQAGCDETIGTFEAALSQLQTAVPELTYMAILVCDVDGDILATIYVGE